MKGETDTGSRSGRQRKASDLFICVCTASILPAHSLPSQLVYVCLFYRNFKFNVVKLINFSILVCGFLHPLKESLWNRMLYVIKRL